MPSIQSYLTETYDAGPLEEAANGILAFPRAMWGQGGNICQVYGGLFSDKEAYGEMGGMLFGVITLPFFLVANVLASPFLLVGLIIKKIALDKNPTAVKVHNIGMNVINNLPLLKQLPQLLEQREKIQVEIDNLQENETKKGLQKDQFLEVIALVDKKIDELVSLVGQEYLDDIEKNKKELLAQVGKYDTEIKQYEIDINACKHDDPTELRTKAKWIEEKERIKEYKQGYLKSLPEQLQAHDQKITQYQNWLNKNIENDVKNSTQT
jgi:hypothetical protein